MSDGGIVCATKLVFLIIKHLFLSLEQYPYILCCFPLTPQSPRRNNLATLVGFFALVGCLCRVARLREIRRCNTCPALRFNVSTRSVTFAVIGCVPTHPAR